MRRMMLVVAAVLVLAGCGGGEGEAATTTASTEAPVTQADVAEAIVARVDPTGEIGVEPDGLAELAAGYCAELETNGAAAGREYAERGLRSKLALVLDDEGGVSPFVKAELMAGIMAGEVVAVAKGMLCPELGGSEYLPPN